MKNLLNDELNKIRLLARYANKAIEDLGLSDLNSVSTGRYGQVLRCTRFYFDISNHYEEGPSLDLPATCKSLYKNINGVNEYITLIDHRHFDSEFSYFTHKKEVHEDQAVVDFKLLLRKAIKNPEKFYTIT